MTGSKGPREEETRAPHTSEGQGDQPRDSLLESSQEQTKQGTAFREDGKFNHVTPLGSGFHQLTCFDSL